VAMIRGLQAVKEQREKPHRQLIQNVGTWPTVKKKGKKTLVINPVTKNKRITLYEAEVTTVATPERLPGVKTFSSNS